MIKSRFLFALFLALFLLTNASALFSVGPNSVRDVNTQSYPYASNTYSTEDINTYWPALNDVSACRDRQDILLKIAPAGCQPTVVRSDLLEEQNVPVMCQVDALEINPLLDIKSIDSISFRGSYPKEVVATGFYPARSALTNRDSLLGDPSINNVGYVTVVLRKQSNESALPESVNLNLTARIQYDALNALGIGQASFILPIQTDSEYQNNSLKQSFWQGRYSIKADELTSTQATISIYYQGRKLTTVRVERGKQSQDIFIPGFSTCQASMKVAYDGFENSGKERATVEISDVQGTDVYEVYSGTKFANNKCSVSSVSMDKDGATGSVRLNCGGKTVDLSLNQDMVSTTSSTTLSKEDQIKKNEYDANVAKSLTEYKRVIESYPSESANTGSETYGETALKAALDLTYDAGLDDEYQKLLTVYEQKYPNVDISYYVNRKVSGIDRSNAIKAVEVSGNFYTIKLLGFTPGAKKSSVSLTVAGKPKTVSLQRNGLDASDTSPSIDSLDAKSGNNNYERIILTSIEPEQITISADCPAYSTSARQVTMNVGDSQTICGKAIRLNKIDGTALGLVRVLPNVQNTQTETNLTVNIGIEKRAIQLSPEKAQKMIDNLNKSIAKWESISKSLDTAVKGLKTACFATAAVLTAKNFITGLDGTALARKQAMEGDKGWTAKCTQDFKEKKYVSIDACLNENSAQINKDVEVRKDAIKEQNTKIDSIEEGTPGIKKETTFGSIVNTEESAKAYYNSLASSGSSTIKDTLTGINVNDVMNGSISYGDMKSLELNAKILENKDSSEVQRASATAEISRIKASVATVVAEKKTIDSYASKLGINEQIDVISTNPKAATYTYSGTTLGTRHGANLPDGYSSNTPVKYIVINNVEYAITLKNQDETNYIIDRVYTVGENNALTAASDAITNDIKNKISGFKKYTEKSYKNIYTNPEVRFHEIEPYKGMPAVVPIDTKEGWYAATQQVLPVLGGQSSYKTSGQVSSFWLCNVGEDGLEEFEKADFGGDYCRQFNFNTGQAIDSFDGLPASKVQSLVSKSIARINQAAKQYSTGVTQVLFDDSNDRIKVGNPSIGITAARCQDYMSPKECLLLFNVCDPVICPSSRCNFGGQYYVANVPETGIVGSALLCLPNVKEKIAIPVCLTGLQTGVDGFVSIMKSHRDCLAEQLTTGKTVGICDEIYSVYMCEFFWKQAAPIANLLVPKVVETAYGQNTKGGGEYLTVMNAWQQTQKSINYFTQQYAVNSIQAFKIRSVAEAGGEFCKAFASIKAPSSLESLVETDSPPQFHAYFSSTKFNDITVPATSQYKVFYHIFAGKDSGVNYQVYLKNSDGTSFYNIPQTVMVSTGFIASGEYASQTKDFTAPEGYKELCVRVNGREECGFQQVSTSFAVNYITDQTRSNEITRTDITSQTECISGTVGSTVALGPNPQALLESTVSPEVYKAGIIRICATDNPGGTTDPSRYTKVGYCDNEAIGCWIDSESVSRSITVQDAGVTNATLSELNQINNNALTDTQTYLDDKTSAGKIKEVQSKLSELEKSTDDSTVINPKAQAIIDEITVLEKQTALNNQLAELGIQRAEAYNLIAKVAKRGISINVVLKSADTKPAETPKATTGIYLEDTKIDGFVKSICFVSDDLNGPSTAPLAAATVAGVTEGSAEVIKELVALGKTPAGNLVVRNGRTYISMGNGAISSGSTTITANALSKLSSGLIFYSIFCAGYETQYNFNQAYAAAANAQSSANDADNEYWDLVFTMAKQSKLAETSFNAISDRVALVSASADNPASSCLKDSTFTSSLANAQNKVTALSLRSDVIVKQYQLYYDNSNVESSGFFLFKTESKITVKEGQTLQTSVVPFKTALDDTKSAIADLNSKIQLCEKLIN